MCSCSSGPILRRLGRRCELIGEAAASIAVDRTALDYVRVFASRSGVVGMPLGSLKLPGGFAYNYIHVRRGDVDLLPDDDLVLEFGDRVGVLCHRADFDAVRRFFGDSIKGVADFSYISLGVGAAMGLLVGLIPIPIPGVGRITLETRRGPAGCARAWPPPSHRNRVDTAAVGEPGAAKLRAHGVPGAGRHRVGTQVRHDGGGERPHAASARRHHHARADRGDDDRGTAARNSCRRSVRRRLRCDRESRHPGVREPRRPLGAARHRLRDGVSVGDSREDLVRSDRRIGPRQLKAAMIARGGRKAIAAIALALSVSATTHAQGRTDVVTLANGDRITGEIVRLERGRLEFKTDDAGTLYLEWDKLSSLVSTRLVEVLTTDGRRFLGSLGPAAVRSITVVTSEVSLQMSEVTLITPIGTSFWRQLDGSIDAGFSYTKSSGVAQLNVNSDTVPQARVPGTPHGVAHPDEERRRFGSRRSGVRWKCRICVIRGSAGSS